MFKNYPPPQPGYLRCVTVQSEAMLVKLLAQGIYQPKRSELKPHSMSNGCRECEDENLWCWSNAHTWMYEQCALKLGLPEMEAGIWLYAHEDTKQNFKEAYNFAAEKKGKVLLVVDVPRDRVVQSDWMLFHEIVCKDPVPSSKSLLVDCDLPENYHLSEESYKWHNDPEISEQERERRKGESWQIIFENNRWPKGVFDNAMGSSDPSIVQGVAPFITIDDIVDVIFQTQAGAWDFLKQGEVLRLYGEFQGFSVLTFTQRGANSRRIGLRLTSAMYGHQRDNTRESAEKGRVHRKKHPYKNKTTNTLWKKREGTDTPSARLIIGRTGRERANDLLREESSD